MNAPADIQIREGRSGDAGEIARVHVETWRSAYSAILSHPPRTLGGFQGAWARLGRQIVEGVGRAEILRHWGKGLPGLLGPAPDRSPERPRK